MDGKPQCKTEWERTYSRSRNKQTSKYRVGGRWLRSTGQDKMGKDRERKQKQKTSTYRAGARRMGSHNARYSRMRKTKEGRRKRRD